MLVVLFCDYLIKKLSGTFVLNGPYVSVENTKSHPLFFNVFVTSVVPVEGVIFTYTRMHYSSWVY